MNSKAVVSVVSAIFLTAAASAFAQRAPLDPNVTQILGQDPNLSVRQQARESNREERRRQIREQQEQQRQAYYDRSGRGAGAYHRYYRGDRLPAEYRHRNYVVNDWRGHRLSAPPHGHYWVQSGSDYLLVAIATGIILNVILNN